MGILLSQQNNEIISIVHAVILSAGEGKRLGEITDKIPKSLIKINTLGNKSILHYTIDLLLKLGVHRIAIVIGYLGNKIDQSIDLLKKDNKILKQTLVLIDASGQYKFGPLYSFLSITKNENVFQSQFIYLVIPGDTIFQYDLLREIFALLSENSQLILKYPLIFYRKIKGMSLKQTTNSEFISLIDLEEVDFQKFLTKIKKVKLKSIHDSNNMKQIIPIFLFPYSFIQEIINTEKKISAKTIKEVINHLLKQGTKILAFKVDSDYKFYDIDTKLDLSKVEKI